MFISKNTSNTNDFMDDLVLLEKYREITKAYTVLHAYEAILSFKEFVESRNQGFKEALKHCATEEGLIPAYCITHAIYSKNMI